MSTGKTDLLTDALAYTARGWSIVPVKFDGSRKRPAVRPADPAERTQGAAECKSGAPVYLYNPDDRRLRRIMEKAPAHLHRYIDHGRWLIHVILWKEIIKDVDRYGFARLHRDILRQYMCRSETAWREYLERRGIIETAGYLAGHKSRGYKLLVGGGTQRWVVANRRLARKISAFRRSRTPGATDDPELAAVVDRRRFILDHLDDALERLTLDMASEEVVKQLQASGRIAAAKQKLHATMACDMISQGQLRRPWVDSKVHRVHSVVTWTSKEIRSHLRLDGRRLVEVDVRNSQPLVLAAIVKHLSQPSQQHLPALLQQVGAQHTPAGAGAPFQYLGVLQMWAFTPSEVAHFQDLAERGRLYEYLGAVSGVGDRDRAKHRFLVDVLFDTPDQRRPMAQAFLKSFPSIYGGIVELKRAAMRDDPWKGHGVLSCLLQRVESIICIDHAAGQLVRKHPEIPFLTIHDAVLIPVDGAEKAKRALEGAFLRFGVRANVECRYPGGSRAGPAAGR